MPFFQEFCKDIHKNAGPVLLIQLAGGILASKLAAPVSIVGIVYSAAGTAIDAVDAQNVVAVRIGCVFLQLHDDRQQHIPGFLAKMWRIELGSGVAPAVTSIQDEFRAGQLDNFNSSFQ